MLSAFAHSSFSDRLPALGVNYFMLKPCHFGRLAERIRQLREELARQQVKDFLEGMFQLGFRRAEILALITQEADENAEGEEKTP